MNLSLMDPFAQNDFPEVIEDILEEGFSTTCSFNRFGTLLAVGCNDGRCIVWDFDTRGVARILNSHVRPVTGVSWTSNSRWLLTSSVDTTVVQWDVSSANVVKRMEFNSPVVSSQIHPKNENLCLVCPLMEVPTLVDLQTNKRYPLEVEVEEASATTGRQKGRDGSGVAVFSRHGDKIYLGSNKGVITIFQTDTRKVLSSHKVCPQASAIRSISWSKNGEQMLVNAADRILRVFDKGDFSKPVEFREVVNGLAWKKCCFSSGDAEYVIGGSAANAEHNIYIWNRKFGALRKILEGPKEGIMDLVWHPRKPMIVSCSTSGLVFIWSKNYTENWSAFAPDFKELEENEEYIEREDEFDVVPEKDKKTDDGAEEEVEVDILGVDDMSEDEDCGDALVHLPTCPLPDKPDEESGNNTQVAGTDIELSLMKGKDGNKRKQVGSNETTPADKKQKPAGKQDAGDSKENTPPTKP
eukprot:GFYU01010793.1.p1 GENE.GFYU01010793.1~~GFYU01010793.1.p1  ORF type:complete len:468 (+),score=119.96 GFYU01010793.1:153-1556(+)